MSGLVIRLLGGFRVCVAGRETPAAAWRLRKARAVVKLLALAPGHRLHREQILELLWPDLDPQAAGNNLRHVLHTARRILEPAASGAWAYLRPQGDLLELAREGDVWIDAEAFESAAATARRQPDPAAYRAAVDLYTGDLLPEDLYEDWVVGRREQLRALFLALLGELARLHEARGELAAAAGVLEQTVAQEPGHEEAHVGLMRLYARSGRRHLAIRQYQQLREALHRLLDVEPDPASQRLYQALLAGDGLPDGPPSTADGAEGADTGEHAPQAADSATTSAPPPAGAGTTARPGPPGSLPAGRGLPIALTSFVGREGELTEVKGRLEAARLVTLTGPGGCGKTRLALQVARDLVGAYIDGAWLVELGAISDPALVPQTVAAALGLREEHAQPALDMVGSYLSLRQALLVLDNCEHLVDACAELAVRLLSTCPGLRILATSREPLNVLGETAWRVPTLPAPDPESPPPLARLAQYEAIRLFVERAQAVLPGFSLSAQNAPSVARICHRLDGLPLAVELAAARVVSLSPSQIAARLDDRFRLLTGGGRTATPRQQTLRGVVTWSHDLLAEPERALFARLSVFAGGWTLEAAEAVCGHEHGVPDALDVLDALSRLVEKSMVVADLEQGGTARYRMLETLREYAREQLEQRGEGEATRRAHAAYYRALAEASEPQVSRGQREEWLARLDAEQDNFRAALAWTVAAGEAETALRLAGALWWAWFLRGAMTEGRRWVERALEVAGEQPATPAFALAKARLSAGMLAALQGDLAVATTLLNQSLAGGGDPWIAAGALRYLGVVALFENDTARAGDALTQSAALSRQIGDRWGLALTLHLSGNAALQRAEPAAARPLFEESLHLFRELDDQWGVATELNGLGNVALRQGDLATARALYEESLAIRRRLDARWHLANSLVSLGEVLRRQDDLVRSAAHYREALERFRDVGDRRNAATCLAELAQVASLHDQPARAATLLAAAATLLRASELRLDPVDRAEYDRTDAEVRRALGDAAYAAAHAAGQAMTWEAAVAYALAGDPTGDRADAPRGDGIDETAPNQFS